MKFQAFKCECGYQCITPEESPKCRDCGKKMVSMDTTSTEYKELDSHINTRLGLV
jgi:hypothetical protein